MSDDELLEVLRALGGDAYNHGVNRLIVFMYEVAREAKGRGLSIEDALREAERTPYPTTLQEAPSEAMFQMALQEVRLRLQPK